jgi:CBS domain-containing protein
VTTVAHLMSPDPVSIRDSATIEEAIAFLVDTGFSAAPVVDAAGRPVGVISRTDIVVYDRERLAWPESGRVYFETSGVGAASGRHRGATQVRDLMTPTVIAVPAETPAEQAAGRMVEGNIHRLFIVDQDGILLGVLSALDLLRHFSRGR